MRWCEGVLCTDLGPGAGVTDQESHLQTLQHTAGELEPVICSPPGRGRGPRCNTCWTLRTAARSALAQIPSTPAQRTANINIGRGFAEFTSNVTSRSKLIVTFQLLVLCSMLSLRRLRWPEDQVVTGSTQAQSSAPATPAPTT